MSGLRGRYSNYVLVLTFVITAAACANSSGEAPDNETATSDPMPWSYAAELVRIDRGEYTKVVEITDGSSQTAMLQEWVTFDLVDRFIDRRIGLGEGSSVPTRADPSLRFLYSGPTVLMWNPGAEEVCGTPWIDMPVKQLEKLTGLSVASGDLYAVEPLDILRNSERPGDPVSSDSRGTTYEIDVPGLTGIPISSFAIENPDVIKEISRQEQTARVRIPRGEGPVEIEIDLTNVLEAVQPGAAGGDASVTWSVQELSEPIPVELPEDVAAASCLK